MRKFQILPTKFRFKEIKVAAITRSIRRGDVITPSDVIEISIAESKATDIFPDSQDLIELSCKNHN